ncbi:MAG: indolepyruvate ferredoxin oxidoreductase subunit alpha [Bacillota bacterium]
MKQLLSGNEAIARGAYEAGVTVATAYPGTPSTEIIENISLFPGIYAEWAPNEKVAMEVGAGASIGGARVLVAMKQVGVNVAADPFFTFSYTGVNGGLVIICADDPGIHSSQNEQDSRNYAKFAKIPMLEPSDSQEAKDFVMLAYQLSEAYDTPVMIRITTRIAHSRSPVALGEREGISLKDYQKNIPKNVMLPVFARQRHRFVEERLEKLALYSEETPLNRIERGAGKIGIVTGGIAYQYVKEAVHSEVSILKLGMAYPLPRRLITRFAAEVDKLYVVEELDPFLEEQIRSWGLAVTGKEIFPRTGELDPETIGAEILGKSMAQTAGTSPEIPGRPPVLCPGCSHRGVFWAINKLHLTVTGDIGCYTLGALPPLEAMNTTVCMGASIGMALGMEKARGTQFARKLVAVIGDSTFLHSGITGLLDMVYNGSTGTVVILDNNTTAMTGHQDHPGTGYTVQKQPARKTDLIALVTALGVERVRVVDPYDLQEVEKTLVEELQAEELSVIIARRPCILLKKEKYAAALVVDTEICNGCKRCRKLGCPGLIFGDQVPAIDPGQCNGCGMCAQVCKQNAIVKAG